MDQATLNQLYKAALERKNRESLKAFIQYFWHIVEPSNPFIPGYHVDAICDHLAHLKEIRNLLINMPPRFAKSTICCVMFFAWYWITHPSCRFVFASYSNQLSIRDSVRSRRLIESDLFRAFYGNVFTLTSDQNTKHRFENDKTGLRLATSIEGCIGGETELYDPIKKKSYRVDSIKEPFHVYSLDQTTGKVVIAKARTPFVKGVTDLYRFHLSNGESFVATLDHRICVYGFQSVNNAHVLYRDQNNTSHGCDSKKESSLRIVGNKRGISSPLSPNDALCFAWLELRHVVPFLPECEASYEHQHYVTSDVHLRKATQDFQYGYHPLCDCDDARPLEVANNDLASSPLQADVHEHISRLWRKDVRDSKQAHIPLLLPCVPPSNSDCYCLCNSGAYITSYSFVRKDVYYDLTVPCYENYINAGIVHHNSATGEGGDITVCDDPHNLQEAESKANREAVIRWFCTVWTSRLNDPKTGCRLVVAQRCHPQDLYGYLIANDIGNDWCKLILPMEYRKNKVVVSNLPNWTDPRTEEGELLAPERFGQKEVEYLKRTVGLRAYNAQYNQCPQGSEDSIFLEENFRYYEAGSYDPSICYRIVTVDLAISTKGDYTVFAVVDVAPTGEMYVVHLVRERMPGAKIVPKLVSLNQVFCPLLIFVEDVAFQRLIIEQARLARLPVKGVKPEGDKVSRSVMLQVRFECQQVFFLKDAPYLSVMEDELKDFPCAAHDDIVDALSYAAIEADKLTRFPPSWRMPSKPTNPEDAERFAKEQADRAYREMMLQGLKA